MWAKIFWADSWLHDAQRALGKDFKESLESLFNCYPIPGSRPTNAELTYFDLLVVRREKGNIWGVYRNYISLLSTNPQQVDVDCGVIDCAFYSWLNPHKSTQKQHKLFRRSTPAEGGEVFLNPPDITLDCEPCFFFFSLWLVSATWGYFPQVAQYFRIQMCSPKAVLDTVEALGSLIRGTALSILGLTRGSQGFPDTIRVPQVPTNIQLITSRSIDYS